jgi:uncharacterized protein (TIGR03000 family)
MYSMVLMAALTTGTDMPDFGRRWGCHGCWGCWGGCYGCYGGYGWGWGGCWGCYGGYGWGCWGGGWGCYGWGGGYGGLGYVYAPVAVSYAAPTAVAYNTLPASTPVTTRSMYPDTSGNRATITVHLPESATLTVDGKPTNSTSATRRFYSPPLQPGKTYHYTFQARMDRDGKTVKAERTVDIRAGDRRDITITMPDLNQPPENRQSAKPEQKTGIGDRRRAGG